MRLEKDANSVADMKKARDETDWDIRHKFGQMSLTKDSDGRGYDIIDVDWEKMRESPPPKKLEVEIIIFGTLAHCFHTDL